MWQLEFVLRSDPYQDAAAKRRYAIQSMSHWIYNITVFTRRELPAPVGEFGR